jgi:hypothetical protein
MAVRVVRHYLAHTLKLRAAEVVRVAARLLARSAEAQVAMLLSTRPWSMDQASAEAEEELEREQMPQRLRFLLVLLAVPTYLEHQRQRPEAVGDVG